MGFLNPVLDERERLRRPVQERPLPGDAQALERYRYLLRTAPPHAIERAHAEAFARLTQEERSQVRRQDGETQCESNQYGATSWSQRGV